MEKGINTEKDFEIAKKIAHVLSGDCSEENRSSLDEWKATGIFMNVF